jgi:arylformamidase
MPDARPGGAPKVFRAHPGDGTLIDISVALREGTAEWPGDTPYSCRWACQIALGDPVNVSVLCGSPHVGTHADAPVHLEAGSVGAGDLPLDAFVGPATVVDARRCVGEIGLEHVAVNRLVGGRLLLRTGRSIAEGSFPDDWPVLSEQCADALLSAGLRLLGVDAPSVDPRTSRTLPVHRALFSHGACILENLDLRNIEAGRYELLAVPVRIAGADAAPVRALLRRFPAP